MTSGMNESVTYELPLKRPSQKQLDFILGLAHRKGQDVILPRSEGRAGVLIEWLQGLPDLRPNVWFENGMPKARPKPKPADPTADLVAAIRERFPELTAATARGMVQLFSQIDSWALMFFFDRLLKDPEAPQDPQALIVYVLRRFLVDIARVTLDDKPLGTG